MKGLGLEALRRIDIHLPRHEETQEKEFSEYVSIIEKELEEGNKAKQSLKEIEQLFDEEEGYSDGYILNRIYKIVKEVLLWDY